MNSPTPHRPPHLVLNTRKDDARDGVEDDDVTLVNACLQGDDRAARALWNRHLSMVRGLLRRMLGPNADLDDDAQEVFMRLFARLHRLSDPTLLRSFLIGFTVRVARKRLTARWRGRWLSVTASGHMPELSHPAADHEARAAISRLYIVLDRLKTNDRLAFLLRNVEELELVQVAHALDVSLATAKRYISHAEDRVRQAMINDPLLESYIAYDAR